MYVERARVRPYSLPELAIPVRGGWNALLDPSHPAGESTAVRSAIARVVREQTQHVDRIEHSLCSQASFASAMSRFAESLASIAILASGAPSTEPSETNHSIEATDRRAASHALYDQFFQVTRSDGAGKNAAIGEILAAFSRALFDAPFTTISRTELLCILRAMLRSLEILAGDQLQQEVGIVPFSLGEHMRTAQALDEAWADADLDPDWTALVADHRWLSGHHLFFIFSNFCRVSLDEVQRHLAAGDSEMVAGCLNDAGLFFRATTSAMWYAGDFPPSLYRSHTRGWMNSAGAANGFSGSDNLDYADLHNSRRDTVNALFSTLGSAAGAWPAEIERAFRGFHEIEIVHAEHHVQIAARMIGTDMSLVQKQMTRVVYNAVDVLRDMVSEQWNELPERFT